MDLNVALDGDEIVVTSPGTACMAAYQKAWDRPKLRLTRSWIDPASPAAAFQAAVSKARELGWIV